MVMGDSQARRTSAHRKWMEEKLGQVRLDWECRGGAVIDTIYDRRALARGYDIVLLMVGGNDLANGADVRTVCHGLSDLADRILAQGVGTVVITALWPRRNRRYNHRARLITERLGRRYEGDRQVVFWRTDKRLPRRLVDGVHLYPGGYFKAARYLLSAILWTIRHRVRG